MSRRELTPDELAALRQADRANRSALAALRRRMRASFQVMPDAICVQRQLRYTWSGQQQMSIFVALYIVEVVTTQAALSPADAALLAQGLRVEAPVQRRTQWVPYRDLMPECWPELNDLVASSLPDGWYTLL